MPFTFGGLTTIAVLPGVARHRFLAGLGFRTSGFLSGAPCMDRLALLRLSLLAPAVRHHEISKSLFEDNGFCSLADSGSAD